MCILYNHPTLKRDCLIDLIYLWQKCHLLTVFGILVPLGDYSGFVLQDLIFIPVRFHGAPVTDSDFVRIRTFSRFVRASLRAVRVGCVSCTLTPGARPQFLFFISARHVCQDPIFLFSMAISLFPQLNKPVFYLSPCIHCCILIIRLKNILFYYLNILKNYSWFTMLCEF